MNRFCARLLRKPGTVARPRQNSSSCRHGEGLAAIVTLEKTMTALSTWRAIEVAASFAHLRCSLMAPGLAAEGQRAGHGQGGRCRELPQRAQEPSPRHADRRL